jgi:methylated-DNA-[protein]-cysteine S-methyltransferase
MRFATQPPEKVMWGVASSPVGRLVVGRTEAGEVCRVAFMCGRKAGEIVSGWQTAWPRTEFLESGDVSDFDAMPRLLTGTAFQHAVWQAMAEIPAGQVRCYGDIARQIGKPLAARAVGAACGANPVPYLVPCHRVVAAGGKLGGFSGGAGVKERLLWAEGAKL